MPATPQAPRSARVRSNWKFYISSLKEKTDLIPDTVCLSVAAMFNLEEGQ